MEKLEVRVGGGSRGRLVYWAYKIYVATCTDESDHLISNGFKFLRKKDKLDVMCYLYGLRSALIHMLEEVIKKRPADHYIVRYYCVNGEVFKILSKWGLGYRDPLIIEVVNSIKSLVNEIGFLDIVRLEMESLEKNLKKFAAQNFYKYITEILNKSRSWEFSDSARHVIYRLPEESKDIPLNFFAEYILQKERRYRNINGLAVFRKDGIVTKVLFYDFDGRKKVVDVLRNVDRSYIGEWSGTFKTLYITRASISKVEDMLLEVVEGV